jgi:hypothetical protein
LRDLLDRTATPRRPEDAATIYATPYQVKTRRGGRQAGADEELGKCWKLSREGGFSTSPLVDPDRGRIER